MDGLKIEKKRNTFFFDKELAPSHMPRRLKKRRSIENTVTFQERKIPERIDRERIIRKSMHETFSEYMVNSSLSGLRFLVDDSKTVTEKVIWLAIIGCATFGFFYFVNNTMQSLNEQPIYTTLEDADYPVEYIIFPAIAICNHNRLKKSAVERLVDVLYAHDNTTFSSKKELMETVTMLGNLYDYSYSNRVAITKLNDYFERLESKLDKSVFIRKSDISNLLKSLTPTCEETLLKCSWRNRVVNCSTLFRMATTQFGFCCTFNYYDTEAGRLVKDPLDPLDIPYIQNDSNPINGLKVAIIANTEEYLYATRHSFGFDILFFDRYDYADQTAGGLVHRLVSVGEKYNMEIEPSGYYSIQAIKQFSVHKRGCKFSDEMNSEFHNHYSLSNCLVRCRMRAIERLCRCVPFFLPRRFNVSACTLEELSCLNTYSQKFLFIYPPKDLPGLEIERENSLNCPQCMPDCTATRYKVMPNRVLHITTNSTPFTSNLNMNDGNISIVNFYYTADTLFIYKVDVTLYWYEIVSYLGGLCGFFTGFSMISLAEFFYYIIIRFSYVLIKNFQMLG